jgi:hypothetical protein
MLETQQINYNESLNIEFRNGHTYSLVSQGTIIVSGNKDVNNIRATLTVKCS